MDLWEIHYTSSKAVTTSPVVLALAAWEEETCLWLLQGWVCWLGALNATQRNRGSGSGHCHKGKKYLVFRGNSNLEFFQKINTRMGPATVACKKRQVKSFPWNCTAFVMKPKEGMGKVFPPLRRRSDGLLFDL